MPLSPISRRKGSVTTSAEPRVSDDIVDVLEEEEEEEEEMPPRSSFSSPWYDHRIWERLPRGKRK